MRTKIVCTLGPASDDDRVLRAMIRAGMDVARVNFSHGSQADHARRIALVRRLAEEEGRLVAVMGDLQGPKFRVGDLPEGGVRLANGQQLVLSADRPYLAAETTDTTDTTKPVIPLPHPDFIDAIRAGQRLLVDDGALVLLASFDALGHEVVCEVVSGGVLSSRKGVSAPGARLAVSALTPKDREDARFAVAQGVDALALSFVRSAGDIRELRSWLHELGCDLHLVAKIEKPEALDDLPAILCESDAVMVARGDLGVESLPEEVPFYQKTIIRACLLAGVPVITATQMLQSMIEAPSPSRAEASDIANAVLDGTDAVMLSGETAVGKYPVESVRAMARIARRAEEHGWAARAATGLDEKSLTLPTAGVPGPDVTTEAITSAAVQVARRVGAKVIVCTTISGHTARMVAHHRPDIPILVLTPNERTYRFTAFIWGVEAALVETYTDTQHMLDLAQEVLERQRYARSGDRLVVIGGVPSGRGATNLIKVHELR